MPALRIQVLPTCQAATSALLGHRHDEAVTVLGDCFDPLRTLLSECLSEGGYLEGEVRLLNERPHARVRSWRRLFADSATGTFLKSIENA